MTPLLDAFCAHPSAHHLAPLSAAWGRWSPLLVCQTTPDRSGCAAAVGKVTGGGERELAESGWPSRRTGGTSESFPRTRSGASTPPRRARRSKAVARFFGNTNGLSRVLTSLLGRATLGAFPTF